MAHQSNDEFVFINSYEMHEFTRGSLFAQLLHKLDITAKPTQSDLEAIREGLRKRTANGRKTILVFNRFDRFGTLDQTLSDSLRYIRDGRRDSIVMIFMTTEPLIESSRTTRDIVSLVSSTTYFPGYTTSELTEITEVTGGNKLDDRALALSGGHHSLLQVLLRCQALDNALSDPMVELLIHDIYQSVNAKRRRQLTSAIVKPGTKVDDPLLQGCNYLPATPLLAEYIKRQSKLHLPVKERRLLRILKNNAGHVVSKQTIFDAVWPEEDGIASDWALNALVYRLRRHGAFDHQRYSIESRKKQGYILHDHSVSRV